MDWLVIIAFLWIVSILIYRNSSFMDNSGYNKRVSDLTNLLSSCDSPIVADFEPPKRPQSANRLCNQFMSAQDKYAYLTSLIWYELRSQVFARDNHTCQHCGSTESLQCHHIRYDYLGDEPLEHLTTLCKLCHTNLHLKLGYDRTTIYPIKELS